MIVSFGGGVPQANEYRKWSEHGGALKHSYRRPVSGCAQCQDDCFFRNDIPEQLCIFFNPNYEQILRFDYDC